MKQLIEFLPIILFFVIYQMDGSTLDIMGWSHTVDGIYSATQALMASTVVMLPLLWLVAGELEKRVLWTAAAVLVFGGATLFFRNELFIQWKPTVFNWGMAGAFALSQYWGSQNLLERLMGSQLQVPPVFGAESAGLGAALFVVGAMNLFVAYRFRANWVAQPWSGFAFTLFIMVVTVAMMGPWLKSQTPGGEEGAP